MASHKDPYSVLGVNRNADQDTIKKAYKKLARKYHPDRNRTPGADEKFKEANAAHDVLGDPEKRKLYDQFGEASLRPGFDPRHARSYGNATSNPFRGGSPGGGGGFDWSFGGGSEMEDLLDQMFGMGGVAGKRPGGRRYQRPGQDQKVELKISFLRSVLGGEQIITVPRPGGHSDTLTIRIPAGVKTGGKLKLRSQGLPPPGGGPCGDLHVVLEVRPHPVLRRLNDLDLEMDVPITILEALQGGSITVPTPTGKVKVKVPAGVGNGQTLRLGGKGIQKRVAKGDLYLHLRPSVPTTASDDALAAAQTLESAYDEHPRAKLAI